MARTKKEQEVVKEEIQEEVQEEIKEEKSKKTTKKTEGPVQKNKSLEEIEIENLLKQVQERKKKRAKQMKLYCKANVPYTAEPDVRKSVVGVFEQGTLLYVEEVINNDLTGSFYKVGDNAYVNQKWDFEVL